MVKMRRVTAQDIALAGSLEDLIKKLVDSIRTGTMDAKESGAMKLRSLTDQSPENVQMIAEAGAIKPLVSIVANGNSMAQAHACVALSKIANERPKYQASMEEAGAVVPLTNVLRMGDSALQEQAAAAIASISQLESSRVPFVKAGAIPPLVGLLKGGSADTHVHICLSLAHLAQGSKEGQTSIARVGALPLLVGLLGGGKAQEAAAQAIAELSRDNEANQAEVTHLGGIPKLIALLTVMSMDAQAQAASALAALATGERQDIITKAGGIRPLLVLVGSRYPACERNAATAIAMLALGHRANQDSIASLGGIMPLVKLTERGHGHTADVQAQAVLALTELSRHNKELQTGISEHGAISSLVTLLKQSGSPIVEAEVAGAFWAMAEDNQGNKEAVATAGAIPALITQLASDAVRAHTNAAHALSTLAFGQAGNQGQIASLLVGLLEEAAPGAQDRAAQSLWRMVKENPGQEMLISKAGGPEPLVRLLSSKQPGAQAYALWSLSLSIDADNQKVVADTGGIIPLVELLSSSGNATTSEQAACAIHRLSANNPSTQQAVAEQGAIGPLIALLRTENSRSPEYAAAALSELSCIPSNKVAIDEGGGIPPLVALLGDGHPLQASKRYAAATLARLAVQEELPAQPQKTLERDSPVPDQQPARLKADEIADAGAIPPLVGLLSGEMGEEAQEEAAGALVALAESIQCRRLINEAGGIAPLVLLLGSTNERTRTHAEGGLVRLSIEKATRVIIIQRLVGMLDSGNTTAAKEQATAALVNLARESTENRMSILEAGGIPKLLELLKESSAKVIENAVSALSKLAYQNKKTQTAIAQASGVSILVATLTHHVKDASGTKLCELTAEAIWNLASDNRHNQTLFLQEDAHPPLVTLITHPLSRLQANAAGALAALSKDHPENQTAIAKSGAIPPICTNVRDGSPATKEESAAALWALSKDNDINKTMIAQLGGVDPLVSMLLFGSTDRSSANAAGALSALATQHADNRLTITKKIVAALDANAPPARAVRFLNAVHTLCENEAPNQDTFSKSAGIQNIIAWTKVANTTEETVQVPAAKAMLAVVGNNAATQSLAGKLGGIPPLVEVLKKSSLEGKEHATCALWHLATLPENQRGIFKAKAIPPLVKLLRANSDSGPQLAAMTLVRLAEGSSKAAMSIARAGGIKPLVRLLTRGTAATQQASASALAALGLVAGNRDFIANAGGIEPLVKLLKDKNIGTPETAARALAHLAWEDGSAKDMNDADEAAESEKADVEEELDTVEEEVTSTNPASTAEAEDAEEEQADARREDIFGVEARRSCIKLAGGVHMLIKMLDGLNLDPHEPLKPATIGGWGAVGVGIQGCTELDELFVGAKVAFGARIGMQEQGAATISYLAEGNKSMQDAIIHQDGVPPLLSLIRDGSPMAQEHSAATMWSLSTDTDNQKVLVSYMSFITDLVTLTKGGAAQATYFTAGALAELLDGFLKHTERGHKYLKSRSSMKVDGKQLVPDELIVQADLAPAEEDALVPDSQRPEVSRRRRVSTIDSAGEAASKDDNPANAAKARRGDVILAILDSGGVPPLVKLCEQGSAEGKGKAAACLWHLAIHNELQKSIAATGGIKPLVTLLSDGDEEGIRCASAALARLAFEHSENQAQIAKRLVGLLDHNDASVVSRAAHDLQSLAQSHPKAPMVIVSAGAISPLVSVLSNGATEEGRSEASKTLYTLANSGDVEIMVGLAIGLVALLGVGTDLAQECVTGLLLTLSSGEDTDLANRKAIANAGPFRMLAQQLRSQNARVRMLASAVMAGLSGDSDENVQTIAAYDGIALLVKLLDSEPNELGMKSQDYATSVLNDMTCSNAEHAVTVTQEGGTAKLITFLLSKQPVDCKARAANVLGAIALDPERAQDVGDAGATEPLIALLKTDNRSAQQCAAYAIAGIAAGGKANQDRVRDAQGITVLVQLLKGAEPTPSDDELKIKVQSNVTRALAELARGNESNQQAITDNGGLLPLISLLNDSPTEQPKEEAAGALWCLASKNRKNQNSIAEVGGMESLVALVGKTTARGQEQAAGALHSLALEHNTNQAKISQLLVQLLRDSKSLSDSQEKAARAISRFAHAGLDEDTPPGHRRNQDSLSEAKCIELTVSLLKPQKYVPVSTKPGTMGAVKADSIPEEEGEEKVVNTGEHHRTQQELCAALWSLSERNESNQKSIAGEGGIPLLIALLDDHPDIHCDAGGALWSLAAEEQNQRLIAEAGGIPKLCDLLKPGAPNVAAQDTASGALHRLAANVANRKLIAEASGITLLVPLFDGGSARTKAHTNDALLALTKENSSNQFNIALGLVGMLSSGSEDGPGEVLSSAQQSRIEAQTHATRVLYTMSFDRENRDAFARTGSVVQLVRQLRSGAEEAQTMASDALTNIARLSADLRAQVTAQLVILLSSNKADVRQRAGTTLRNNNAEGGEGKKQQRQAAVSGGVAPLVDLLKAGLNDDRLEAQEYALRSLSMINDESKRRNMVEEGCIPAVTQCLALGKLSADSQQHAITVLALLSADRENHNEIIQKRGIPPLIEALSKAEELSTTAKRFAAIGLAHLAADDAERQELICEAIEPLVKWLQQAEESDGTSLRPQAALSVAAICRGNKELQKRVAQAGAIVPLVAMLESRVGSEAHEAACASLATLSVDSASNQEGVAKAGAIPLLIDLIQDSKPAIRENASFAIAMLSDLVENKVVIAYEGGIEPLIELLSTGNEAAKQFAARAISLLAHDNPENQLALVLAATPLAELLGSDSTETQEWAQLALLRLALNPGNRAIIVRPLVGMLSGRSTSAQLKATECLAMLLERCPAARSTIAKAGAIVRLVELLGNGQRADRFTPPERSAAVLSELVRLAESKVEVVRAGGLQPLVVMLSSPCKESQAHAACALWHLSVVAEHKPMIIKLQSIMPLVSLLTHGTIFAQKCAARTLWQLSSLTDAKALLVQANGISSLVMCLSRSRKVHAAAEEPTVPVILAPLLEEEDAPVAASAPASEDTAVESTSQQVAAVQEAVAAILSEMACTQSANRALVVEAGGLNVIMDVVCEMSAKSVALQHVTKALWGLSQERTNRTRIAKRTEVITRLVELLLSSTGETQKLAAATLVTLGQDESACLLMGDAIKGDDTGQTKALDTLQMLQFVQDSFLRTQVAELMMLIGVASAPSSNNKFQPAALSMASFSPRVMSNPAPLIAYTAPIIPMPMSPRIAGGASRTTTSTRGANEVLLDLYRARLEANPDMWMCKRTKNKKEEVTDLHMAELAVQFKANETVNVTTETPEGEQVLRKATIRYVGKAPEIAPGFWIGVEFDTNHGKNDGSAGGTRYFTCQPEHGSFLRPNKIQKEWIPPGSPSTAGSRTRAAMAAKFAAAQEKDFDNDLEREAGDVVGDLPSPPKHKAGKLKLKSVAKAKQEEGRAPTARMGTSRKGTKSPKSSSDQPSTQRGKKKKSPGKITADGAGDS